MRSLWASAAFMFCPVAFLDFIWTAGFISICLWQIRFQFHLQRSPPVSVKFKFSVFCIRELYRKAHTLTQVQLHLLVWSKNIKSLKKKKRKITWQHLACASHRIEFNLIKLCNPGDEMALNVTWLNTDREGHEELRLRSFNHLPYLQRPVYRSTQTLLFHSFKWDSMTVVVADELCMCYCVDMW